MSLNAMLLKMLLSSDTPIVLLSEKMLSEDDDENPLEKALLEKPRSQIVPFAS